MNLESKVSIPLRGRCNVNQAKCNNHSAECRQWFPSPCGEDVMSTLEEIGVTEEDFEDVSIPLRGRCNVNALNSVKKVAPSRKFPSPCGEDVMSTRRCNYSYSYLQRFPSPCGEDVMSTEINRSNTFSVYGVSIPLRGRCNVNIETLCL